MKLRGARRARTTPNEVEQRILRILAGCAGQLKSRQIMAGSGLSANEVQSACPWLRGNQDMFGFACFLKNGVTATAHRAMRGEQGR
jgi:hypothetical protein